MAKNKRGPQRDAAGVGPDPASARRRLLSIDDLNGYTLAAGEPDIRGWEVRTLGGRELGEVEDLLVDPDRGEVVMLEIDLRGEAGARAEVPIRSVQLDRARRVVVMDSGDVDARNLMRTDARADLADRERLDQDRIDQDRLDRNRVRDDVPRDARYATGDAPVRIDDNVEETVVERRPVVEEVVVRRRIVDVDRAAPENE